MHGNNEKFALSNVFHPLYRNMFDWNFYSAGSGRCQMPVSEIPDPGIRTPVLYDREIAPFAKISQIQAQIFINILTG